MRRVLRPGASGVIIDLRRDTSMAEITRYVNRLGLGFVNRWLTLLVFRWMLLKRAYTKPELEKMFGAAGLAKTEVRTADIGSLVREVNLSYFFSS